MVAIAVGSGAMIVLFSVFNGFEDLIKDLYKSFYPEIKISPKAGKFFPLDPGKVMAIKSVTGVGAVTTVIEDNVLLNSNEEQYIATLKGVDANFVAVNNIKPYIYAGRDSVSAYPIPTALLGLRIASQLGVDPDNVFSTMMVYYPNTTLKNPSLNPTEAFQSVKLKPDGIFRIQEEFDSKYILAPLSLTQELFLQKNQISSIELSLEEGADAEEVRVKLAGIVGPDFKIATRYEQNRTLYMVMQTEKWVVYAILVLVLLIASFNMVGALTMLVLEKQKDVAILKAMGATPATIRQVFILEGVLWAGVGGATGIALGLLICLGQQHFNWIQLQGAFLIESYPVALRPLDFVVVIATVLLVGLAAAAYPAIRSTRVEDPSLKAS